jgi:hypothetical protein
MNVRDQFLSMAILDYRMENRPDSGKIDGWVQIL